MASTSFFITDGAPHQIRVLTKATDDPLEFRVFWGTGPRKQGLLVVRLAECLAGYDRKSIAELSALHHLLDVKELLGDSAGHHVCVSVSLGSVRKLMLRQGQTDVESDKNYLGRFSKVLLIRFADAEFRVDQSESWMRKDIETIRTEQIDVAEPPAHLIDMPGVGKVSLQIHAFRQFCIRCSVASGTSAWHHIRKLVGAGCVKSCPPNREEGNRYKHPEGWIFVLSQAVPPELVTIYYDR